MNADDEIAVTLTAVQWQVMLQILAEQPFKIAAPLIQVIQRRFVQYETELGRDDDRGQSPAAWKAGGNDD